MNMEVDTSRSSGVTQTDQGTNPWADYAAPERDEFTEEVVDLLMNLLGSTDADTKDALRELVGSAIENMSAKDAASGIADLGDVLSEVIGLLDSQESNSEEAPAIDAEEIDKLKNELQGVKAGEDTPEEDELINQILESADASPDGISPELLAKLFGITEEQAEKIIYEADNFQPEEGSSLTGGNGDKKASKQELLDLLDKSNGGNNDEKVNSEEVDKFLEENPVEPPAEEEMNGAPEAGGGASGGGPGGGASPGGGAGGGPSGGGSGPEESAAAETAESEAAAEQEAAQTGENALIDVFNGYKDGDEISADSVMGDWANRLGYEEGTDEYDDFMDDEEIQDAVQDTLGTDGQDEVTTWGEARENPDGGEKRDPSQMAKRTVNDALTPRNPTESLIGGTAGQSGGGGKKD